MFKLVLGIIAGAFTIFPASGDVHPDSVRFFGNQPGYAGINIVFQRVTNFIIPSSSPVASLQVDSLGNFDFTFPLSDTIYIFADLGRTRAWAYIEPGRAYQLVLPPFRPLTLQERLNPLFKPEEVMIGIANRESQTLNRNIAEFDAMFNHAVSAGAVEIFTRSDINQANKIRTSLDSLFTFNHPTFTRHKELRYIRLMDIALRRQQRQLIYSSLSRQDVEFDLPAYWEVFKDMFTGFFPNRYDELTREKLLRGIAQRERFDSIANITALDSLFAPNRELNELVLLFSLYEAFYRQDLSQNTVLTITRSAKEHASSESIRTKARELYQKMTMLQPGTEAPSFSLLDRDGRRRELSDFRNRFVYLNFIHTKNFGCLQDLETITRLNREFSRNLQIVTIVIDDQFEEMEKFLANNPRFNWYFLHHGAYPRVLHDYNVQSVPAYYLIDPNGKLVLSPAPSPGRNFREQLISQLREHQRQNQRRATPAERRAFGW